MNRKPTARLIAHDDRLVAETCKSAIQPQFEVAGVVTDGRALIEAANALKPNIAAYIGMPNLNGLDAGEQIKRKMPQAKLVFRP